MMRNFKYRLFTNGNQERELAAVLETHRRLYNRALDGKMLCWETAGYNWTFPDQNLWLTKQRHLNEYLGRVDANSAAQTLRSLDRAYSAFFRRCKQGGNPGHPRFKGRDRFNSFTFRKISGWKIVDGKLRLRGIGVMRVRWHRELPECDIRTVTILRERDKWFVCFAAKVPDPQPSVSSACVGIDVGLKSFVTTSDGESLGDSRTLEAALPELRRRQRALSRCKQGSNRRQLVKQRVTRLHAKVRNVRKDMHHKVARSLVDRYGVIAAESLNITGLLRNRRLARRISDAGWGQFIAILTSKAESAGCRVELVDAKNTSQACSSCGELVRKSLAVRVHQCECGCVLDRDVNAARNILGRAVPDGDNVKVTLRRHKSRRLTSVE